MKIIKNSFTDTQKNRLLGILRKEAKFIPPDEVFLRLIDKGTRLRLKRRESIIKEGETDDNVYFIVNGVMRICYNNGNQEITHAFGIDGTMVHPMHCYYENEPSPDTYEACCTTELLKIDRTDFDIMLANDVRFTQWILSVEQHQLYHFELRNRVIRGNATERYRKLVKHRPEIMQKVPLKIIASYLGITPEYLSIIRSRSTI